LNDDKLVALLDALIEEVGEDENGGTVFRHWRATLPEWRLTELDMRARNCSGMLAHCYFSDKAYRLLCDLADHLGNLTGPTYCIKTLLDDAVLIDCGHAIPKLDAELLLSAVLGKPRSYLYAWPEKRPSKKQVKTFYRFTERLKAGEPLAYILGKQGFYSLELGVNPHCLIPRADTETLVEAALSRLPDSPIKLLDLGTGSGAIALALAKERTNWQVIGVDKSSEVVALAEQNRKQLKIKNAQFLLSDWFAALSGQHFAAILSNPPYIAENDEHLEQGDLRFEPKTALVGGKDGLDDLRHIIRHAPNYLKASGCLLLEHGWQQAEAVRELLAVAGFVDIESLRDLGGNWRVSLGKLR